MSISVILAHPDSRSFNHAIAAACVRALGALGHDVHFHDLYAQHFDPILRFEELGRDAPLPRLIEQHCTEIAAAPDIVIVHPNWGGNLRPS